MNNKKNILILGIEIAVGAALIVLCEALGWDGRWEGMGAALIVVAALNLVRLLRVEKDPEYREQYETEAKDERNVYIRQKAWAWAGTAFVMVAGVLSIVFLILKNDLMTTVVGSGVCLLLTLYWISWLILRKKY